MSFLRERSPVTPKITRALGPAIRLRRRSSGSRSGVCPREMGTDISRGISCWLLLCGFEEGEHVGGRVGDRQRDDGTPVLGEDGGIAGGLRLDELTEGERPLGDLEIHLCALEDLQEHALRRAALV